MWKLRAPTCTCTQHKHTEHGSNGGDVCSGCNVCSGSSDSDLCGSTLAAPCFPLQNHLIVEPGILRDIRHLLIAKSLKWSQDVY